MSDLALRRHFTISLKNMDSQALLAEYKRNGSESAFRQLVTNYGGLVYSTALRLVGGDTHLAQDVAQLVFLDLARKADGLSNTVMLGGWLHKRTCNVAAPIMRSDRRRMAREKQAVEINALRNDSDDALAQISSVLDEAITSLRSQDRDAILLRFFEKCNFRTLGQALGTSDDAAQKRVARALEKLHYLLKRRGVTLSAAALAAGLTSETLTAMPSGLAASLAGTAVAAASGAGTQSTLLKIMALSKFKVVLLSTLLVAGLATHLFLQQRSINILRRENAFLREQNQKFSQSETKIVGGEKMEPNDGSLRVKNDELTGEAELLRLRGEIGVLRRQNNEITTRLPNIARQPTVQSNTNELDQKLDQFLAIPESSGLGSSTPEETVLTCVWAISHTNAGVYIRSHAETLAGAMSTEQAEEDVQRHSELYGPLKGIQVTKRRVTESVAYLEFTYAWEGAPRMKNTPTGGMVELSQFGDDWKITNWVDLIAARKR